MSLSTKKYATLVDTAPGLMRPGVDLGFYTKAVNDSRTIFIEGTGVPIAVPIEYSPWIRAEYFENQGVTEGLFVYAGWPELCKSLRVDPVKIHVKLLEQLKTIKAALIFEQSPQRNVRPLLETAFKKTDSAWHFKDLYTEGTLPNEDRTRYRTDHHIYEYQYSGLNIRSNPTANISDIYKMFSTDGTTVLLAQLFPSEISKTFDEYCEAFRNTQYHGAIDAIIPEDDFASWMLKPEFLKYVQRDQHGVVNMCVLTSVRNVGYIQTSYFKDDSYQQLIKDEILCCPIMYSRRGAPKGCAKKTTTGIASSFKAVCVYPKLILECNDVSDKYIPRIFKDGSTAAGLELTVGNEASLVQSVELASTSG